MVIFVITLAFGLSARFNRTGRKVFFVRKSLKVSFLRVDNDVIVWLIVRYKNETFLMFLQKVSLKSHRSIINYPFGEFMSRKEGIKVEKCLLFQLNKVHRLVSWCPLHGHLETMYWASREHVLGTGCPHHGHRVPNVWDCFWALYATMKRCHIIMVMTYGM